MALNFYQQTLNPKRKDIRLLELSKGTHTDTVTCNLKVVSLETPNIVYEALSYVWGEIEGHVSIHVCGKTFGATANLEAALRHLRYEDRSRLLWVDAVCINQSDVQERNSQVKLMGSIYECANRVVVWLGPADRKSTKVTVKLIHQLANNPKLHWTSQAPAIGYENNTGSLRDSEISEAALDRFGLFMFFRLPWWTRMWTLQEMAKARELIFVCGHYVIPGDVLKSLVNSFNLHYGKCCEDEANSGVATLPNIENRMVELARIEQLRESRARVGFLELAGLYRYRIATDPHDMVYGLLGMSSDLDNEVINYQLPAATAYEAAALALISKTGNLDVFSHVIEHPFESSTSTEGLPSWVPDWRLEYRFQDLRYSAKRQEVFAMFHTSAKIPIDITQSSPGEVTISGLGFDTVEKTAPTKVSSLLITYETLNEWRRLAEVDTNPEEPYVGGKTVIDAFWRTLCCDMSVKGDKSRATFEDRVLHDEWWWMYLLLENKESPKEYVRKLRQDILNGVNQLALLIYSLTAGRRFFRSKNGYMGAGPSDTRIGDQICVLFGGKTPFILRWRGNSSELSEGAKEEWKLVGDAYVHGIMDGEAIRMMESESLKRRTFTIS